MRSVKGFVAAAAVAGALAFSAGAASAATHLLGGSGDLVPTNSLATSTGPTTAPEYLKDYFTFDLTKDAYVYVDFSDFNTKPALADAIIDLYAGTPTSVGSLVESASISLVSGVGYFGGGSGLSKLLDSGDYFIEVLSSSEAKVPKGLSYTAAAVATAVPEPATWLMMIGGIGLIGIGLRMRSKEQLTIAG
jgi:hypothetical protein